MSTLQQAGSVALLGDVRSIYTRMANAQPYSVPQKRVVGSLALVAQDRTPTTGSPQISLQLILFVTN